MQQVEKIRYGEMQGRAQPGLKILSGKKKCPRWWRKSIAQTKQFYREYSSVQLFKVEVLDASQCDTL